MFSNTNDTIGRLADYVVSKDFAYKSLNCLFGALLGGIVDIPSTYVTLAIGMAWKYPDQCASADSGLMKVILAQSAVLVSLGAYGMFRLSRMDNEHQSQSFHDTVNSSTTSKYEAPEVR